jgi:sulfate transport system substrate-binding protein
MRTLIRSIAVAGLVALAMTGPSAADITILNVSYDPTRELYKAYDAAFAAYWQQKTGENVTVEQSHGGSGAQARAVIDGLEADVVTLALEGDINKIAEAGLVAADWRSRFPGNSTPYTSTIVFLVHKGNPKGIRDWGDLVKDGVEVITPNPKTSGGARWNYLAAWAYANEQFAGDEAKIREFVGTLYRHVIVDANVDRKGTREVALAYLEFLYSEEGQNIVAKNFYRPSKPEVVDPDELERFPELKLVSIDDPLFGGWAQVQPKHFDEGAIFDQIYQPGQ